MDEIDQTFERLRRISFKQLMDKIEKYTNGYDARLVNPLLNEMFIHPSVHSFCEENGWPVEEVNAELNNNEIE